MNISNPQGEQDPKQGQTQPTQPVQPTLPVEPVKPMQPTQSQQLTKTPLENPNDQNLKGKVEDTLDGSEDMPTLEDTKKYGNKVYHPGKQTTAGE